MTGTQSDTTAEMTDNSERTLCVFTKPSARIATTDRSAFEDDAVKAALQAYEDAVVTFTENPEPSLDAEEREQTAHEALALSVRASRDALLEAVDAFCAYRVASALNPNGKTYRSN